MIQLPFSGVLRCIVLAMGLGAAAAAGAETLYVIDTLRVGVRPEPSTRVAPTHVITTGAVLEVLERQDGFVHIRTAEGIEGWIKAVYASPNPPARQALEDLRGRHRELQARVKELEESLKAAQNGMHALSADVERLQGENMKLRLELARAQGERGARTAAPSSSFLLVLGAVAALAAAFGAGYFWHRRTTQRFLGGHRL